MHPEPKEWEIKSDHANPKQFAKFQGKHPAEYNSLFANLQKIINLLDSGNKIGGFQVGFFRSEGGQVYRIGQTTVPHAKESRLYLFPHQESRTLYLLGIGDKDSQDADIAGAKETVKKIFPPNPPEK